MSLNTSSPAYQQLETALRAQHEKYANPAKPFPADPIAAASAQDYFYWKRSPAHFELYAALEAEPTAERNTAHCPGVPQLTYFDYGISSIWREEGAPLPDTAFLNTPL